MRLILEILEGPQAGRKAWITDGGSMRVGKASSADVVVNDAQVSDIHFQIDIRGGSCWLCDLESTSGTFVNESSVAATELVDGVRIRVGSTLFLVRIERRWMPGPGIVRESAAHVSPNLAPHDALNSEAVDVGTTEGVVSGAGEGRLDRVPQNILLPGQTPQGQYILSVLVKRTYDIHENASCARADTDRKLVPADTHYGDPMNTSVQFESDFVPFKLSTDIVLNGTAYAPGGVPTTEFVASLYVGDLAKHLFILGNRVCKYRKGALPEFTAPQPIDKLALGYERAYGGVDIFSAPQLPCPYARNHLGRGFVIKNVRESVDDLELPNIEELNDRLTPERLCVGDVARWEGQPMPAGFGWYSRYWYPRAPLAGVMPADQLAEQEMRLAYAQAVPADQRALYEQTRLPEMDFRYFSGASPGLIADAFLQGNEVVRTTNLTSEGDFQFQLPSERPFVSIDIGAGSQQPEVFLQTIMIRMDDRQVDMVWRAAIPYAGPDSLPGLQTLEVVAA